ncbi:hypothetical protein ABZW96_35425 [Nocardia sp. NPDC004168]
MAVARGESITEIAKKTGIPQTPPHPATSWRLRGRPAPWSVSVMDAAAP